MRPCCEARGFGDGGERRAGACEGRGDIPASGRRVSANCWEGALRVVFVLTGSERLGGGDFLREWRVGGGR